MKQNPKIVIADKLIKKRVFFTKEGKRIENTEQDPNAIERHLSSLKR